MHADIFRILSVLAGGTAESGDILDRIRQLAPHDHPSMTTFYRRLKHALDEGWVVVEPAEAEGRGRPAHRYRITVAGLERARQEAERLQAFSDLLADAEPAG